MTRVGIDGHQTASVGAHVVLGMVDEIPVFQLASEITLLHVVAVECDCFLGSRRLAMQDRDANQQEDAKQHDWLDRAHVDLAAYESGEADERLTMVVARFEASEAARVTVCS